MTEDLLHFIWKFKLLRPIPLCTTARLPLKIVHPGHANAHAGPDFTNGRIVLNNTEWAGNIEIHRRSSDWDLHNHQVDEAYDNVVLHVVHEHDREVFTSKKRAVPCLELRHYIEPGLLERYELLYKNRREIPCGNQFAQCKEVSRTAWLERMLTSRLEGKTAFIKELFDSTRHSWDETFYLLLCKNFGFSVNAGPFLLLGRTMPLTMLLRYREDLTRLEALLFGAAGLLAGELTGEYPRRLQQEYAFLQHKHQLPPPAGAAAWKFLRMRPDNFPTLRLAQMAAFIHTYQHTFSKLMEARTAEEAIGLFKVSVSPYWQNHYTFKKEALKKSRELGRSSLENILINTVCPLLFFYGKERQQEDLCEKALDWYSELKAEDNHVTRSYAELGFKAEHAGHSQALLQLHANYCSTHQCLQCGIGASLLKS